mmetsp:Transcript_11386/g.28515  ORF Transcript_11386/g.28515 Transcript_11386/m.28515 type:complete len:203 (+) Transcript_11386:144-752(+)
MPAGVSLPCERRAGAASGPAPLPAAPRALGLHDGALCRRAGVRLRARGWVRGQRDELLVDGERGDDERAAEEGVGRDAVAEQQRGEGGGPQRLAAQDDRGVHRGQVLEDERLQPDGGGGAPEPRVEHGARHRPRRRVARARVPARGGGGQQRAQLRAHLPRRAAGGGGGDGERGERAEHALDRGEGQLILGVLLHRLVNDEV